MVGKDGFEPPLTDSKSVDLPLVYFPKQEAHRVFSSMGSSLEVYQASSPHKNTGPIIMDLDDSVPANPGKRDAQGDD